MTENAEMVEEQAVTAETGPKPPAAVYDPDAKNRFEYKYKEDGFVYDIAFIFGPVSDERYLQWIREFKVSGNDDDVSEESREASCRLWDDLILEAENVEYEKGADWRSLIDNQEKIDSLNDLLAVAVVEAAEPAAGRRKLGGSTTQTVVTEAWVNGEAVQQRHELQKKSFELEKKYSRIQAKRFKQTTVGGALKRKPKIEYVPQDEALGRLYDEMLVKAEGFADERIPLRFKTTVMHELFASKLDQKK